VRSRSDLDVISARECDEQDDRQHDHRHNGHADDEIAFLLFLPQSLRLQEFLPARSSSHNCWLRARSVAFCSDLVSMAVTACA